MALQPNATSSSRALGGLGHYGQLQHVSRSVQALHRQTRLLARHGRRLAHTLVTRQPGHRPPLNVTAAAIPTGSISNDTGIVIVDHGSRKRDSNDMLHEFGQLYQETTMAGIVEVAHMELAEPTIEQAIGKCVERGAVKVVVAPYFLSRGRHIQEDIPALVAAAQERYPHVTCIVAEPIGIDPLMAQLISNRVQQAIGAHTGVSFNGKGF